MKILVAAAVLVGLFCACTVVEAADHAIYADQDSWVNAAKRKKSINNERGDCAVFSLEAK